METVKSNSLKGLKICFIAGTLGVGGAERQLYLIIKALVELDADISLICLNAGEFWERPIQEIGIKYYTFNGKWGKVIRLYKIITLLVQIKPKVIQSQHFYTNLYAAIGAFFCGAKSIGASRNDLKIEIKGNGIFGKISFLLPQYLVMNSQQSIDYGLKISNRKKKFFYLSNAIDQSIFNSQFRTEDNKYFTVLGIGRLVSQKRFDIFIKMVAILKEKASNYKIRAIIIGSGFLENDLKKQAKLLGLTNVDLEFISESDSPEIYMQKSDLFVLTSDFEGTPNVVLEAMACGLPVISTKVGNLPNIIKSGENGFFFDGSVEDLINVVMNTLEKREILKRISKNAEQTIADNFSINALKIKLITLYANIID